MFEIFKKWCQKFFVWPDRPVYRSKKWFFPFFGPILSSSWISKFSFFFSINFKCKKAEIKRGENDFLIIQKYSFLLKYRSICIIIINEFYTVKLKLIYLSWTIIVYFIFAFKFFNFPLLNIWPSPFSGNWCFELLWNKRK